MNKTEDGERLILEWGSDLQQEWAEDPTKQNMLGVLKGSLAAICMARKAHAESLAAQAQAALYFDQRNSVTREMTDEQLKELILEPANHVLQLSDDIVNSSSRY